MCLYYFSLYINVFFAVVMHIKCYFRIKDKPLSSSGDGIPAGQLWVFLRAHAFLQACAAFKSRGNAGTGRGSGPDESWSRVSRDTVKSWTWSPRWDFECFSVSFQQSHNRNDLFFKNLAILIQKSRSGSKLQAITRYLRVTLLSVPESSTPKVSILLLSDSWHYHTIFLLWFLTHRRPWAHSIYTAQFIPKWPESTAAVSVCAIVSACVRTINIWTRRASTAYRIIPLVLQRVLLGKCLIIKPHAYFYENLYILLQVFPCPWVVLN